MRKLIKGTRRELNRKIDQDTIINYLFYGMFIWFILGSLFDATVTATVATHNRDYFMKYELSEGFKQTVRNGDHFLINSFNLIKIFPALFFIISFGLYKEYKNKITASIFITMYFIMLLASSLYITGGLSWL